ncbi:unnamed protein product [Rotaria magnacalcarata]|uniref:G protein-coupled receptor n=1 Tax=Rotaria magnacalcarata TaxID=392030 RepID=A0A816VMH1_9BILA|nr:unnamed protein product [Rotaria magnacalcarata]CAF1592466.1 unnamed protein product [Rotaria magnacalcarata]CAF1996308.1 unnamed protein product [Rotaria magnacalcarata]CAF2122783.1 unnamed protein product [Rotaria magnacalcarata]CAF4133106.1 unnamed protein product [Rotaria magnacalcarata]
MFFHFLVPALINLIAIICTILSAARSRAKAQQSIPFKNHILHEISRQRHVIATPVMIVLLSFPRIIIPFFVRCMKTPRNPTLYIIGYFISYAPPILTFFLFVLPSDTYRDACRKALRLAKRRFHCAQ